MHATPSHDRRRLVVAVLAAVTTGWLPACTGDDTPTSDDATEITEAPAANASDAAADAPDDASTNTGSDSGTGGDAATPAGSESDIAARDADGDGDTADTAPVDTVYDETERTPLDELPDKVAEIVSAQAGDDADTATVDCIVGELLAAYDDGQVTASDLDAYVRLSQVTEPIAAVLQQLQADGACTP